MATELMREATVDTSGGVNSAAEPFLLAENEFAEMANSVLNTVGKREMRNGCQSVGAPAASPAGCGFYQDEEATGWLLGIWDSDLYKSNGNGAWSKINTTGTSFGPENAWGVVQAKGLFDVYSSGVTLAKTSLMVWAYNMTTSVSYASIVGVRPWDGTINRLSVHPRALCWFQGRIWAGNLPWSEGGPDCLAWGNIFDCETISTANSVLVDPGKGDEIMALIPPRASTTRLYIFKRRSIHALDVVWSGGATIPATENSLDTTASALPMLSGSVGCVAPATVVYSSGEANADIFFLAADGYRSLQRVEQDTASGTGLPVSDPIQDVIDRVNWTMAHTAWAQVWDKKIFLALPLDGATAPNHTYVYDLQLSKWLGEWTYTPKHVMTADILRSGEYMYGQSYSAMADIITGQTAATSTAHMYHMWKPGVYLDPGQTAITYSETSRAHIFKNLAVRKSWNWYELTMTPVGTAATFHLEYKVDDAAFKHLAYLGIDPEYVYPTLPAPLPWTLNDQKTSRRQVSLLDVPVGRMLQIRTSVATAQVNIRATRIAAWPYEETWEDA